MAALPLAAVGSARRQAGVALAADLPVAVGLGGEHFERWLDDTTTETAWANERISYCAWSTDTIGDRDETQAWCPFFQRCGSLPAYRMCLATISIKCKDSPKHKVQRALLLDVVVAQSPSVLELLAGKDKSLLIRRDSLLILDLGLDIVNGVARLHLKGDRLACQSLDEDLHLYG